MEQRSAILTPVVAESGGEEIPSTTLPEREMVTLHTERYSVDDTKQLIISKATVLDP
ncbi:MAG: hypothetical protein AAF591_18470 [Verrucomicrobiota bacterium]